MNFSRINKNSAGTHKKYPLFLWSFTEKIPDMPDEADSSIKKNAVNSDSCHHITENQSSPTAVRLIGILSEQPAGCTNQKRKIADDPPTTPEKPQLEENKHTKDADCTKRIDPLFQRIRKSGDTFPQLFRVSELMKKILCERIGDRILRTQKNQKPCSCKPKKDCETNFHPFVHLPHLRRSISVIPLYQNPPYFRNPFRQSPISRNFECAAPETVYKTVFPCYNIM